MDLDSRFNDYMVVWGWKHRLIMHPIYIIHEGVKPEHHAKIRHYVQADVIQIDTPQEPPYLIPNRGTYVYIGSKELDLEPSIVWRREGEKWAAEGRGVSDADLQDYLDQYGPEADQWGMRPSRGNAW